MINGYCKTNLDEFKRTEWPTQFVALPREGDWVEGKNGEDTLRVVKVTHRMMIHHSLGSKSTILPGIVVELHKVN